jgi:hypothetical protein
MPTVTRRPQVETLPQIEERRSDPDTHQPHRYRSRLLPGGQGPVHDCQLVIQRATTIEFQRTRQVWEVKHTHCLQLLLGELQRALRRRKEI